jgi:flagellin-like hook-associated protein FlgL
MPSFSIPLSGLNSSSTGLSVIANNQLNLSQQENNLVGADMATVATDFSQSQVANQATLNATARVLSLPTLLDFLK